MISYKQYSKYREAKIDKRLQYYLIGVILGCLILIVIPRPFRFDRSRIGDTTNPSHEYFPVLYSDGYDRPVEVTAPPKRIISLSPNITEILYALNVSDRLVANTRLCKYPGEAQNKVKIGDPNHPDFDLLLRLQPDLILGTVLSPQPLYERMEKSGLVAIAMKHTRMNIILHDMLMIGKIIGEPETALGLVVEIQNKRDSIINRISTLRIEQYPVRVVILYDSEQLYTADHNTWIEAFIKQCEAINIANKAFMQSASNSLEEIAVSDPEVIILALPPEESGQNEGDHIIKTIENHPLWQKTTALREQRIVKLDKNLLFASGFRIIEAMDALGHAIHPEIILPP